MELAGWTNDRLVAERVARLPREEWVYGRPNASVVMAAFLHAPPTGMRFSGPDLGAWYAAAALTTAVIEVAHHLRREAAATGKAALKRTYRTYTAELAGSYLDVRGGQPSRAELYDPQSYAAGQVFGEKVRADGGDGLLFASVRHAGGVDVVAYRPSKVMNVVQTDHYELTVGPASNEIQARKLAS